MAKINYPPPVVLQPFSPSALYWQQVGRRTSGGLASSPLKAVTLPEIQGNNWEEGLLHCTFGTWKDRPDTFSFQWTRNGANISGATNQNYTLVSADVGTAIGCTVTATNSLTSQNNSVNVQLENAVTDNYATKVLSYSPIAFWRFNETSGTNADNAEGTAALDGTYSTFIEKGEVHFKDASWCARSTGTAANINLYSATLNTVMDRDVGSVTVWARPTTNTDWTDINTDRYLFNFRTDTQNYICLRHISGGTWKAQREASNTLKEVDIDMTDNPTGWVSFTLTWDVNAGADGEFKVYRGTTQQGTTQTNINTWTGNLNSIVCCALAFRSDNNSNNLPTFRIANLAVFDSVLDSSDITDLNTVSTGKYWTHAIAKTWAINTLFSVTGRSLAHFFYDVDNDGERELVISVGDAARWAAIKSDNTIVWDTGNIDATSLSSARHPCIRNGVLYQTHGSTLYAIRLSDGVKLWETSSVPDNDLRAGNDYLVCCASFTLSLYNYSDGTLHATVTLPYETGTQTLSFGDIDGDGFDEYFTNDYDGRIMARDHDLTELFTIQYDHGHIDYMVVDDIDEDGNNELVAVIDTDETHANEGDELAIFSSSGTLKDSYQGNGGQVQYRVLPTKINGVKIVGGNLDGSAESFGLDKDLNEVYTLVGAGARIDLGYIGGSTMVFYPNTEADIENAEIAVIDIENGERFRIYHEDSGIELDNKTSEVVDSGFVLGAGTDTKQFVEPYIRREVATSDVNTLSTGNELIRLHEWTLEDIP